MTKQSECKGEEKTKKVKVARDLISSQVNQNNTISEYLIGNMTYLQKSHFYHIARNVHFVLKTWKCRCSTANEVNSFMFFFSQWEKKGIKSIAVLEHIFITSLRWKAVP